MLNLSSRRSQILIDGYDFSDYLVSFEGSDNHLDQSGLISFSGQLVLGKPLTGTEPLDDRVNTKFCRGKTVIISCQDAALTMRRHPRGALRILKSSYDDETKRLTIELGDLISLLNFKEATDPDDAGNRNESCSGLNAGQVITNLLNKVGITNIGGDLPTTKYNYPLNMGGSYIETVGKILYANNYFGWVNSDEIFRIETVDIAGGNPGISIVVGENELYYKRLNGAESPVEKVKTVGNEITAASGLYTVESVVETYGSSSAVLGNTSGFMGSPVFDIVIDRTISKRSYNGSVVTEEITNYQPYGLVIPQILWGTNSRTSLIKAEYSEIKSYYGGDESGGKLLYKTTLNKKVRGSYLGEISGQFPNEFFGGITDVVTVLRSREDYIYNQDLISQQQKNTSELNLAVLDGTGEEWSAPPTNEYLVASEIENQRWSEPSKGTVVYESTLYQSVCRVPNAAIVVDEASGESNRLDLIKASSESRFSTSGQETPPAAERSPARCITTEEQIEETVSFTDICASDLKPRERTFTVELLPGKGSNELGEARSLLKAIAIREGRLLKGREKGQEIATDIRDYFFDNYVPLISVYCKEKDGTIQSYLSDGCSWILSVNRALWACDGIWVGTLTGVSAVEDGDIIVSTVIPAVISTLNIEFGFAQGLKARRYPYSLEKINLTCQLGLACGLKVSKLTGIGFATGLEININEQYGGTISVDIGHAFGILNVINKNVYLGFSVGAIATKVSSINLGVGHGFTVNKTIYVSAGQATGVTVIRGINIYLGSGQGVEITSDIDWLEIDSNIWNDLTFPEWQNITFGD